jgi:hypothetical protein
MSVIVKGVVGVIRQHCEQHMSQKNHGSFATLQGDRSWKSHVYCGQGCGGESSL